MKRKQIIHKNNQEFEFVVVLSLIIVYFVTIFRIILSSLSPRDRYASLCLSIIDMDVMMHGFVKFHYDREMKTI